MSLILAQLGSLDRAKGYLVLFLVAGTLLMLFLLVAAGLVDFIRKHGNRHSKSNSCGIAPDRRI